MTDRGFFILADISGFTAFVTTTELEHGPPIVAELLEEVIRRTRTRLQAIRQRLAASRPGRSS